MPRSSTRKKDLAATVEVVEDEDHHSAEDEAPAKKPRLTLKVRRKLHLSIDDYCPKEPGNVLLTCGNGDIGQLGCGEHDGDEKCSKPKRVAKLVPHADSFVQVCAGSFHTVVLTSQHQVYTCGCNDDCALGRDCFEDNGKTKRVDDQDFFLRPVEYIKNYAEQHGKVVQVSAGDSHTAALTQRGSVLVWGTFRDKQGCLGMTANGMDKSPSSAKKSKMSKGAFVAKSAAPALISSYHQRAIVKIASGFNHLTMLSSDGLIYTLGAGDCGQLGRLAPQFRDSSSSDRTKSRMLLPQVVAPEHSRTKIFFKDIWCAGYCCFARSTEDTIYVWGLNNYFQLGFVPNDPNETMIYYPIKSDQFNSDRKWTDFTGDHHIAAIDDQNNAFAIGRGDDSRLGIGRDSEQQTLAQIEPLNGQVAGLAANNNCTFVWKKDGKAAVWGCDMEGEMGLGLEDSETVKTPTDLKFQDGDLKILQIAVGGQHTVFLAKTV